MTDLKARLEALAAKAMSAAPATERLDAHYEIAAHLPEIIAALSAAERVRGLEGACRDALEIITDSWGEDQIERGYDQACNVLRAILAKQEQQ